MDDQHGDSKNRITLRRLRLGRAGGVIIGTVALLAAIRLVLLLISNPDRIPTDLVIFVQVVLFFVIGSYLFVLGFGVLVAAGTSRVRKQRPSAMTLTTMVYPEFASVANASGILLTERRMPQSLARPTLSIDSSGITIWFGHRKPMPGACIRADLINDISLSTRAKSTGALNVQFQAAGQSRFLEFRVTRLTIAGQITIRDPIYARHLQANLLHILGKTSDSS
jgi:hypothetical protein